MFKKTLCGRAVSVPQVALFMLHGFAGSGCVGSWSVDLSDYEPQEVEIDGPSELEREDFSTYCQDVLSLEVVALDIWARELPGARISLAENGSPVSLTPTLIGDLLPMNNRPVSFEVSVSASDHRATELEVLYDGGSGIFSIVLGEPSEGARSAQAFRLETVGTAEVECQVVTVFVGLDHDWFSPVAAPPTQNLVELKMDGERYWESVYQELTAADRRITWSTWLWESDFELYRPEGELFSTEPTRWERTVLGLLEAKPDVQRRVLVNNFAEGISGAEYLSIDRDLMRWAESADDNFEVMLQGNEVQLTSEGVYRGTPVDFDFPTRVQANPQFSDREVLVRKNVDLFELSVAGGSYHQKAIVVDGDVAFVSGMNTKGTDWDDSDHSVFNPRRMEIDASASDRVDVQRSQQLPDFGPRKDYGVRVEGPATRDVESILQRRWDLNMERTEIYAEHATSWDLDAAPDVQGGTVLTQVVATLPPPLNEMSILKAHLKAVGNAKEYIYIEDQYFRSPILVDAIIDQMMLESELVLIVVTKFVSDWDPGAKHTYLSDSRVRNLFPDRYLLLQLKSFDAVIDQGWFDDETLAYFEPIDTHSKLRLIDDKYLSVGSCNFNNRGYLYEGELNVEVFDEGLATLARQDIFANLVGDAWAHLISDDPRANIDLLATVAAENQAHQQWWDEHADDVDSHWFAAALRDHSPSGFVYPLEFSDDYWWDVGPDLF